MNVVRDRVDRLRAQFLMRMNVRSTALGHTDWVMSFDEACIVLNVLQTDEDHLVAALKLGSAILAGHVTTPEGGYDVDVKDFVNDVGRAIDIFMREKQVLLDECARLDLALKSAPLLATRKKTDNHSLDLRGTLGGMPHQECKVDAPTNGCLLLTVRTY